MSKSSNSEFEAGLNRPGGPTEDEVFEAVSLLRFRALRMLHDPERDADTATLASFEAALAAEMPIVPADSIRAIAARAIRHSGRRPAPQFRPDPADPFALVSCPEIDVRLRATRRKALTMYLETRAERLAKPEEATVEAVTAPEIVGPEARAKALGMDGRTKTLASFRFDPSEADAPTTWLVKGLLPKTGLGLLYGESQAGKSFLSVWLALSVAWGLPLFGRRTKPGGVLYVAAEGGKSVKRRFRVADAKLRDDTLAENLRRKGQPPLERAPVEIVHESPNLSRDGDPDALARTIRQAAADFEHEGSHLALVVLDTWHASLGGADENSAADAGHALRPLKAAIEETGAFVLVVHHPGKAVEQGARGSSALLAAVDTSIELNVPGCSGPKPKPAGARREATIIKQRDGETGGQLHFRLPVVEIGVDEDGDPVTTCLVEPCEAPAVDALGKPKGKGDRRFAEAMSKAQAEAGTARLDLKVVRGFFNNMGDQKETDDARRVAWNRALSAARAAGVVNLDSLDQFIWFASSEEAI